MKPKPYVKNGRRAIRRQDGTFKRWEPVRKQRKNPSARDNEDSTIWLLGGIAILAVVGLGLLGPLTGETEVIY